MCGKIKNELTGTHDIGWHMRSEGIMLRQRVVKAERGEGRSEGEGEGSICWCQGRDRPGGMRSMLCGAVTSGKARSMHSSTVTDISE